MNREEKIEALRQIYRDYHNDPKFTKLRSHQGPKRVVPGRGSMDPLAVLVGEAPGEAEQAIRRPFQGPAGRFLDQLIASVGWDRRELFITNAVKYRPTTGINLIRNRTPNTPECNASRPYLFRELDLFPGVPVITFGHTATRCLRTPRHEQLEILHSQAGHPSMMDLHGTAWFDDERRYFCMYHPAATFHRILPSVLMADMAVAKAWVDDTDHEAWLDDPT